MKIADNYPSSIFEEENYDLMIPVTLVEIQFVLSLSKNDKSPGPDGIPVEVYRALFDVMGSDLLRVIGDTRQYGKIPAVFNSTFLALIPNSDSPKSFDDFRPISLCNFIYNIIGKSFLFVSEIFWGDIYLMNSLVSCLEDRYMRLLLLFRKVFIVRV